MSETRNEYMEQVQQAQAQVSNDLRAKRKAMPSGHVVMPSPARHAVAGNIANNVGGNLGGDEPSRRYRLAQLEPTPAAGVDVRITGWWRWRTVVVPPNAHVVHTRRGHAQPLHIGLGVSFGFNPATDSFLVVPGTMQTIMINAYCICRELQGLLVQGYVQWIVADFATAYKKLDFSDVEDPMRVVNVQLREQAEAAIKDKVATMGIDEVLSDKQPIIEELTARLRHVAEGGGDSDKGLGLRIVTVQIKEAVVSSKRVWENLQKPFRAERAQAARLAELAAETVIAARERAVQQERESAELEAEAVLAQIRAGKEAEAFDRETSEATRRALRAEEDERAAAAERHATALAAAELDKVRAVSDAEVARLRAAAAAEQQRLELEAELGRRALEQAAANQQAEIEVRLLAARQTIANEATPASLHAQLIERLPAIADKLPRPTELRTVQIGGDGGGGGLASLVAQVMAVVDGFRNRETEK